MDPAARTFVERLGLHFASEGLPLIAGRVTAYLLISEGPRSLDEIAGALGVSRASVSTDARRLEEKGFLVRLSLPGDRRTYYSFAPDGFRKALVGRIRLLTSLREMLEAAGEIPAAKASPEVRDRLEEWTDFHVAVIDSLQDLLTKWNKRSTTAKRLASSRRRRSATA
jgi:DNA-binding transcriptional regulator GbsR (MarR family)